MFLDLSILGYIAQLAFLISELLCGLSVCDISGCPRETVGFFKFTTSSFIPYCFQLIFLGIICPWLPLATLCMHRQTQLRDNQGHFTCSTQQPEDQPPQTPALANTSRPSRLQCAFTAVSLPFHFSIPISEAVACATAIFQESSSDIPMASLINLEVPLPLPTRYVPLPQYVTDPLLPHLDFSAINLDDSVLLGPPLPSPASTQPLQLLAHDPLDDKFFFTDNKQLRQQPLPLPPH